MKFRIWLRIFLFSLFWFRLLLTNHSPHPFGLLLDLWLMLLLLVFWRVYNSELRLRNCFVSNRRLINSRYCILNNLLLDFNSFEVLFHRFSRRRLWQWLFYPWLIFIISIKVWIEISERSNMISLLLIDTNWSLVLMFLDRLFSWYKVIQFKLRHFRVWIPLLNDIENVCHVFGVTVSNNSHV